MSIKFKVYKTDARFSLYKYGFTHYLEFPSDDWRSYNKIVAHCRKLFKYEFWDFAGRVYQDGSWRGVSCHRGKKWNSKRIYFRGEKFITTLRLSVPDDPNTVYL